MTLVVVEFRMPLAEPFLVGVPAEKARTATDSDQSKDKQQEISKGNLHL